MTVPMIACLLLGGRSATASTGAWSCCASDVVARRALAALAALALTHTLTFVALAGIVAVYGVGTAFFTPAFESIVPELVRDRGARTGERARPVRPADRAAPRRSRTRGLARRDLRRRQPRSRSTPSSFARLGGGHRHDAPARQRRCVPAGVSPLADDRGRVPLRARQRLALGHARCRPRSRTSRSSGRPRRCCRTCVKNELHGSAGDLGLVFAAGGVGAIGAAALMAQRGHPRRDVTFMYVCWTLATLAVAGYGLGRSTVQLMIVCFVFNALEAAGTIVWATIKQRHVPLVAARTGVEPRLADLDRSPPRLVRAHRPGVGADRSSHDARRRCPGRHERDGRSAAHPRDARRGGTAAGQCRHEDSGPCGITSVNASQGVCVVLADRYTL